MEISHIYQAKGKRPYIVSQANFNTEKEALIYAKRQISSFYDGTGVWLKVEDYI